MFGSTNPVAAKVNKATHETLLNPDWTLNMDICDFINGRSDFAQMFADTVAKKLESKNPKVVILALTLVEAAVKNCDNTVHTSVGSGAFLSVMENVATRAQDLGTKEQALSIIQQWGLAFRDAAHLEFFSLYSDLKARGEPFPEVDSAPVFTPPPSGVVGGGAPVKELPTIEEQYEKLGNDLETVKEKMKLCNAMMDENGVNPADDVLDELVDFLQQCFPRITKLINAGMEGRLNEESTAKCLEVNDEICTVLERHRNGGVSISSDGVKPSSATNTDSGSNGEALEDLLGISATPNPSTMPPPAPSKNPFDPPAPSPNIDPFAPSTSAIETSNNPFAAPVESHTAPREKTADDDFFSSLGLKEEQATKTVNQENKNDEFDDFFNQRS